ncbi:deoxynucleoside kinase [Lactobacillus alvi]|uniref:Deoxynucleoside kinase n=1 Tax=Limosilactobacillus alvi TaxID=990412 RepID=A0ABS2EMQ8_9LACO|nr:deoxynucleoside kinase [Limosilactobacillus alvi]MBM6753779.1 deoxynucleoside kinase [Limosilactobacillus alvi]
MIVLAGTIGAGKTSLTQLLADHLGTKAYFESVDDNPILPLFYKDPQKYGFLLQIYFLNRRLEEIKAASLQKLSVLDRSIFEDDLMFRMNADLGRATETEADIYASLLKNMMEKLPNQQTEKKPDLLIHIQVSFPTMLERIKKRGRAYEQIETDPALYNYYQELNHRYTSWYDQYQESPKMLINGDQYNFVEDPKAAQTVLEMIDEKLSALNLK